MSQNPTFFVINLKGAEKIFEERILFMSKKIISAFLCAVIAVSVFTCFQVPGFADEISDNELTLIDGTPSLARSANFNLITSGISVENDVANGTAFLAGSGTDITKIIVFLYIQKEIGYDDWEIIEDKMVVINNYYGGASITCDDPEKVEHGHNYRLRVSGYAYKGTSYTGDVVYSDVKYYP